MEEHKNTAREHAFDAVADARPEWLGGYQGKTTFNAPPPLDARWTGAEAAHVPFINRAVLDHAALTPQLSRGLVLPTDTGEREQFPLWDGLMAYFPNALAQIARLSKIGNDQHNPGERMHWARGKSKDHRNKILKHLIDAGPLDALVYDADTVAHSVKAAWRALAFAEEQLNHAGRPYGENATP